MIRLSGPGLGAVLDEILSLSPGGRGVWRTGVRISERALLPALCLNFPAPNSYTGEHSVELLIPGNPALVARVMSRLAALPGVREATPGEFSARAYLNGRLGLDQAEGVAAVIGARTDAELGAARHLLAGETGRGYRAWADEIATLLALVEAGIDFTDQEDVVAIAPGELDRRAGELLAGIDAALGSLRIVEHTDVRATVVLAGRPNAGKSTLFNALLGRRRAVVSPVAGTTRDILVEPLDLSADIPGGPVVSLVDLAGLDAAAADGTSAIDAEAQQRAAEAVEGADVVVHCDPTGRFAAAIAGGGPPSRPVIRLRTMADLPAGAMGGAAGDVETGALAICALDGWNLGPLRRAIADAAWSAGRSGGSADTGLLLPRHRRALAQAASRLREAREVVAPDLATGRLGTPELVAGSLRAALDAMEELAGRVTPDDIVGRIFATFCVGK